MIFLSTHFHRKSRDLDGLRQGSITEGGVESRHAWAWKDSESHESLWTRKSPDCLDIIVRGPYAPEAGMIKAPASWSSAQPFHQFPPLRPQGRFARLSKRRAFSSR